MFVSKGMPSFAGWSDSTCASSKLLRPRNQGLTLRLNSGLKTAKLRRYARRCCLPRLTWRPCHSGDVSAPRRPGVGERRFAAASDGAEERAPTPTARRHGTGFLGCSSRFVARVGVCIVKTAPPTKSRTYAPLEFRAEDGETPPLCSTLLSSSSHLASVPFGRCVGAAPTWCWRTSLCGSK